MAVDLVVLIFSMMLNLKEGLRHSRFDDWRNGGIALGVSFWDFRKVPSFPLLSVIKD